MGRRSLLELSVSLTLYLTTVPHPSPHRQHSQYAPPKQRCTAVLPFFAGFSGGREGGRAGLCVGWGMGGGGVGPYSLHPS